jgi:wobble nucleotide-excising tRNase
MSSFDSERRRKTVHLIADIACKYSEVDGIEKRLTPRQKIILTHEDRFAKELKRLIPSAKTLKIEECSVDGQRGSKISYADFEQEFPDVGISNRVEAIRRILNERTFAIPFEAECRVILEHIFRRKYGLELKDEIGSRKSIRTFTTKLSQEEVNGFEDTIKFQKFIRLCDDLNIELHDNGSVTSNGDKELVLRDFFECLKIV